jgi:hypothetical protein
MDLVKEYKEKSTFKNEQDIFESLTHVFMFGSIKSEYKSTQIIHNKEEMNSLIIKLLEQILSNDLANTRKDKLTIINLLDELNFRNEILHLIASKNLSQNVDIKESSDRLGKKFMSSVKK